MPGSAKRLSPVGAASSERRSAIDATSRAPGRRPRDVTMRGRVARLSANLLRATLGIIDSATPTDELVSDKSSGAGSFDRA